MNRVLIAFLGAAMPLTALAQTSSDSLIGNYRLQAGDEVQALARLSGASAPKCYLCLTGDRKFTLRTEAPGRIATRTGTFSLDGSQLLLKGPEGDLHGSQTGSRLILEGLAFVREQAVAPAAQATPPRSFDIAGVWTPHKNGKEDRSIKMNLGKDGNFNFSCWGAKSAGKWEVQGGKLVLMWTQVDDQKIELGAMRKEIPLSEDGASFNIDAYHYERSQ